MRSEIINDVIDKSTLNESFSVKYLNDVPFLTGTFYRPDYNLILLIAKGRIRLTVDGNVIDAVKDNVVIVSKGEVYSFIDVQAEGFILKFGNCFWDKAPISANNCKALLFDNSGADRQFALESDNRRELLFLFKDVLCDYQGGYYPNKADALAAYLKIIVIKIANIHALIQQSAGTFDTKLYQRFRLLVQQDFKRQHDVAHYAEKLNVSTRKLHDICKAAGTGAKETITGELISEAKRLLQFTSLSIKEISSMLGFTSPYHFSSFFKKTVLLSPATYRLELVEISI